MTTMDRRQFLAMTSGTAALLAYNASDPPLSLGSTSAPRIKLQAWTAAGQPMPTQVLNQTFFLTLADEPIPNPPRQVEKGTLWSVPPSFPFAIVLYLSVQGFGNVVLYADNQGRGYTPSDFPLNLNLACAQSRLGRVRRAIATWQQQGYQCSSQIQAQLRQAETFLQQALAASTPKEMAALANDSLRESLWAGEAAVFAQAQYQISCRGHRPNFLFGCNFFRHPEAGLAYDQRFKKLFNFATLPFYWRSFEPEQGQPNFAKTDEMVNWLEQSGITPKGHPLVWFHEIGLPDWARDKPYAELQDLLHQRVRDITGRYLERIPYYDIINEAHDIDWANIMGFSAEQQRQMTRLASKATVAGYPNLQRIVNTCCHWAEYIARGPQHPPLQSAYQYLQTCITTNIPFEIIGMQLYYPNQDMFEINRLLERFSQLGKPIHITELGVSSNTTRAQNTPFPNPPGLWHAPWSEAVQADWVEQFYTLCYSKPYIQAVTWWDLADGGFWPHGGLIRSDFTPKLSYLRLTTLQKKWLALSS
ncbi:endo-1,4-beta-xylanase [Acaryochloris sp. IP29b_bin.148]|uniref:endo-1,4-beta-xylanase n=1 Tax=Acaryochloris sp. IP29b_bin.148 TaxID=2969218 RepID=UPI002633D0C8|nr:endo-1,4-beta-xylanase [Acaryochloris sp. IP29b_bin.148]